MKFTGNLVPIMLRRTRKAGSCLLFFAWAILMDPIYPESQWAALLFFVFISFGLGFGFGGIVKRFHFKGEDE
jgi:hypothetical protein